MATPEPGPAGPAQPVRTITTRGHRLAGVDVARGIALLGMMAVHVLPDDDLVHDLAHGRSAALFALLAGAGLALASGGADRPTGNDLARARRGTLARAAVVLVVGLTLGGVPTTAAVILPYYAVLFALAVPVLGWPARRLAVAAVLAAVLTPLLSQFLRLTLNRAPGPNLSFEALADPGGSLVTLLLTGYYPVLTWTTYLLAGLAVGRLPLRRAGVAARVAVTGAVLAAGAAIGSSVAVAAAGDRLPDAGNDILLRFYGTTPVDTWWWLAVDRPHSGTPFDLVHTTGTALLVLGVALLVVPRVGAALTPLAAAGSMTLTLYSVHVLALGLGTSVLDDPDAVAWPLYLTHVAVALVAATLWRRTGARGPLEEVAAVAAAGARGRPEPADPQAGRGR